MLNHGKVKLVDVAKKRRHIYLLEKMQRGKSETPALSRSEIQELQTLEDGQENSPESVTTVNSQSRLAKLFGVSVRTVGNWIVEGMPVMPGGKYDIIEVRAWRELKKNKKKEKQDGKKGKEYWETEYRKFKAQMAEITLRKMKGQVLLRSVVESELCQICQTINSNIQLFEKWLPPKLQGLNEKEMAEIIKDCTKQILRAISDFKVLTKEFVAASQAAPNSGFLMDIGNNDQVVGEGSYDVTKKGD